MSDERNPSEGKDQLMLRLVPAGVSLALLSEMTREADCIRTLPVGSLNQEVFYPIRGREAVRTAMAPGIGAFHPGLAIDAGEFMRKRRFKSGMFDAAAAALQAEFFRLAAILRTGSAHEITEEGVRLSERAETERLAPHAPRLRPTASRPPFPPITLLDLGISVRRLLLVRLLESPFGSLPSWGHPKLVYQQSVVRYLGGSEKAAALFDPDRAIRDAAPTKAIGTRRVGKHIQDQLWKEGARMIADAQASAEAFGSFCETLEI